MLKLEWWAIVVPLAVVSAILQDMLFPGSSPLWQLPIGAFVGFIAQSYLNA